MLQRKSKLFVLIISCIMGMFLAWYFWPVNLTKEASKVANAWLHDNLNDLWPHVTDQEKQKLTQQQLQQAYKIIIKEKLGGIKIISPAKPDGSNSPTERMAICTVETSDGTQLKLGFLIFKEENKVSAQGLHFLVYLLERYYVSKEKIDQIDARLKAYQTLKQELQKIGMHEVYEFYKNEWRTFDSMIDSCQLLIAWRDSTQKKNKIPNVFIPLW